MRNTEKLLERMEIVRKIGDKSGEGNALWGVAICKMNEGKTKEARTLLTEALKIFQVIESSSAKKIQEMLDKLDKES